MSLRQHLSLPVKQLARAVRFEAKAWVRHARGTRRARSLTPPLRLHIGAGHNLKPGWTNVDLDTEGTIHVDLRRRWPFPDGSAEIVYAEHCFEHFRYPLETGHFLAEAFRALRSGARISIGVPNAGAALVSYATEDAEGFRIGRELFHPEWCDTWMHQINYIFRQNGEHHYAYDEETLVRVLEDAGFVHVGSRPFDPDLDQGRWQGGTLYVDGVKP